MTSPVTDRGADDSLLSRRNPTVKLALLAAVSGALLFVFDPVTPAVLYVLALAAVLALTDVGPRALALAQLPFGGFALGLFVINALSRTGEPFAHIGVLHITVEGLTVGASLGLRTLVIGTLSVGFLVSTDPVALMTSLQQQARVGPRVAYALLAGYRMLQDMPREWLTIRRAHAVRSAARAHGSLPNGWRDLARAAFALLVVSIRRGEQIARTLESRGLGLTPRTTWRPMTVTAADWAMVATVAVVLAGVLVAGPALWALIGPSVL